MNDGQPTPTDPQGIQTNTAVAGNQEPTSIYDKTEAIVKRQEEANKKTEELLAKQETLHANQRLAGTTGGNVEPKEPAKLSDEDYANKLKTGEVNPMKEDGISID